VLTKIATFEKGTYNAADHTIEWVLSSEAEDRDGEILEVDGWVDRGQHIPLMWAHRTGFADVTDVLGDVREQWNSGKKRVGRVRFSQAHDVSKTAEVMVAEGVLRNGSVGFRPWKWTNQDGSKAERKEGDPLPYPQRGRRYTKQEMVEFSIVPVPANLAAQSKTPSLELDEETKRWLTDIVKTIVHDEMEGKRVLQSAVALFAQ